MLKIFGADLSSPANKVRFVANEIGVEYEYIKVRIADGEHRKEEFMNMNPVGKIPVMDDNGFFLFESGAISKYLIDQQKGALYVDDLKQRAVIDQWSEFAAIHINGAMGRVLFNRVFAPIIKIEPDNASIKAGLEFLDQFLPVVNNRLGESVYLAGEKFSLADLTLIASLDPFEIAEIDISDYKNLVRYRDELRQKDFYTKCFKVYGEGVRQLLK